MGHTRLDTHQQLQAGKWVRRRHKWVRLDTDHVLEGLDSTLNWKPLQGLKCCIRGQNYITK